MSEFVAFTPEQFHELDDKLTEINTYRLVAVNDTAKLAMEQLLQTAGLSSIPVVVKTPITIAEEGYWTQSNIRLCWVKDNKMDVAPLSFYVNENLPTVYAQGVSGTMAGVLGYSEEWVAMD